MGLKVHRNEKNCVYIRNNGLIAQKMQYSPKMHSMTCRQKYVFLDVLMQSLQALKDRTPINNLTKPQ